ncbi:MAG: peptidoglycan-binding protein [Geobacter sp.]|nr:MAG: peptidoglycan-binding protein [Geobacter sp.]
MSTFFKFSMFFFCGIFLLLHPTPSSAAPSPEIKHLGYAIQMGAFADVKNAERFTAKLQSKGIEAFYFRKDSGIYAVRFGDFPTKEKARKTANRLVAEHMIGSYYIAPPNEVVFTQPKEPGWQKSPPDEIHNSREVQHTGTTRDEADERKRKQAAATDRNQGRPLQQDKDMGVIAARTAERFVGIPYRWGGNNVVDGMDCSGFVRAVYNLCGISIPRTSREQFTAGDPVIKDNLRDGDLVFFGSSEAKINHVGIYVGNGKFVHAPRRGEEIRVTSIDDNYFEKHFVGARRYFQ